VISASDEYLSEVSCIIIVKIPGGSYWKYSQMWASINSWLAFLATFTVYVQEEKLITKSKVRKILFCFCILF
jgi:hypothetical protein